MPNPLNNTNQQSFADYVSNISNPQAFANTLLQQNPGAQKLIQQLKNTANGKSPREMAYQLAKQQGIDPAQLDQLIHKLGLQ